MAGTLVAAYDATYPTLRRVGVTLSGWVSPANGAITVMRVHPDTTEWVVRGFGSTSGGAAFAWDYEAPFGVPVSYYAMDGTTKVVSSAVTIVSTQMMLRVPGLPSLDVPISLVRKPRRKYPRPAVTLRPIGRTTSVLLTGSRSAGDFEVVLETTSDSAAAALLAALTTAATVLLVLPGLRSGHAYQYVTVADVDEDPQAPALLSADAPVAGAWSWWTLPCVVVDCPTGGIYGDPTASYAVIASTYATYTALKAAKATYLDVIKGV